MPNVEMAGRLQHRITVEVNQPTANARGELVDSWTAESTRWALVEPLQGRELFAAQQRFAEVSHRITMRWVEGLTPKKRLRFNGRVFNILSALNIQETGAETIVLAKELV